MRLRSVDARSSPPTSRFSTVGFPVSSAHAFSIPLRLFSQIFILLFADLFACDGACQRFLPKAQNHRKRSVLLFLDRRYPYFTRWDAYCVWPRHCDVEK